MTKRAVAIAGILGALLGGTAHAQYASVEQDRAAKKASEEQTAAAERQKYIGRRFWVEPNPKAISRLEFVESIGQHAFNDSKFVVTELVSFVVSGFRRAHYEDYVEVTFDDGKIAHLKENPIFDVDPHKYALFENLYSLNDSKVDWKEYVLPMSPGDLRAALAKKRSKAAAAAAAWKARGGVSIGMTADQVLKSNWGKPSSINRTSGTYGVHEQWVYGGHNYIYLENGRVTSIQN